jgi:hypothetical protein
VPWKNIQLVSEITSIPKKHFLKNGSREIMQAS